jgi:hypothetical protein
MPSTRDQVQREILPVPDRPYTGVIKYDAKDPEAKFAPIEPLLPPTGAPNVLVILIDDVGFGASSAFGGPCETPHFERLAAGGWAAVTKHRTPWLTGPTATGPFDEDRWELYDTTKDWTQAQDLAQQEPERLEELERLWLIEAIRFNVLPLDDRTAERFNAELAGRPDLMRGRKSLLLGQGMGRLSENTVPNVKNKSFYVTAELVMPHHGAEGALVSQGGRFGGWSFYVKGGRAKFCYNFVGLEAFYTEAQQPIPAGKHQVRAEFAYDGGGVGKGGTVSLYLDGNKVAQGRVERTQPFVFAADETMDVGYDAGTPVTDDLPASNAFTGKIEWVEVSIGDEDYDHFIDAKELLKIAMIRQ